MFATLRAFMWIILQLHRGAIDSVYREVRKHTRCYVDIIKYLICSKCNYIEIYVRREIKIVDYTRSINFNRETRPGWDREYKYKENV